MKPLLLLGTLSVYCLAVHAASPPASSVQANSARSNAQSEVSKASAAVDIVSGQPRVVVRVTNLATVPLEAWSVRLLYQSVTGRSSVVDYTAETLFDEFPPGTPGHGPIPPGDTREERIALGAVPTSVSAELQMVLFSDSSSQGSAEDVDSVFRRRERYGEALQAWIEALAALPGKGAPESKAYLHRFLVSEERRGDNTDSLVIAAQEDIAALIRADDDSPGWSDRAAALKQRFERQHARALRHQKAR